MPSLSTTAVTNDDTSVTMTPPLVTCNPTTAPVTITAAAALPPPPTTATIATTVAVASTATTKANHNTVVVVSESKKQRPAAEARKRRKEILNKQLSKQPKNLVSSIATSKDVVETTNTNEHLGTTCDTTSIQITDNNLVAVAAAAAAAVVELGSTNLAVPTNADNNVDIVMDSNLAIDMPFLDDAAIAATAAAVARNSNPTDSGDDATTTTTTNNYPLPPSEQHSTKNNNSQKRPRNNEDDNNGDDFEDDDDSEEDDDGEGNHTMQRTGRNKKTQIRYDPSIPMDKDQLAAWRREARRVRNRESAAASRQRTRGRITELEDELTSWKQKYAEAALELKKQQEGNNFESEKTDV
jgi:hypothetical protein